MPSARSCRMMRSSAGGLLVRQRRRRLVHDDDRRAQHERAGDLDDLLLGGREAACRSGRIDLELPMPSRAKTCRGSALRLRAANRGSRRGPGSLPRKTFSATLRSARSSAPGRSRRFRVRRASRGEANADGCAIDRDRALVRVARRRTGRGSASTCRRRSRRPARALRRGADRARRRSTPARTGSPCRSLSPRRRADRKASKLRVSPPCQLVRGKPAPFARIAATFLAA